jgi:hypothetical protein
MTRSEGVAESAPYEIREFFWNITRTHRRSDTLIEVNRNIGPAEGYNSARGDSNDAFKTKLHTLIAYGVSVPRDIGPTGE